MSNIEMLEKIGFSKYQASVYVCLLRKGPLDAKILSRESHVPMGKIYDTLSQLLMNDTIIEHAGRPKTYEAIIPEIAFQRIYMKYYLDHEKQREDLKNTITRLEQELVRNKQPAPAIQDLQIMHSNEDILKYFIRLHNEAEKEVIYVIQVRYGSFDTELDKRTLHALMNNMVRLLKRGISVRVIYPDSPFLDFFPGLLPASRMMISSNCIMIWWKSGCAIPSITSSSLIPRSAFLNLRTSGISPGRLP
jgi:sugar-specific transcriptional regulator TrmB